MTYLFLVTIGPVQGFIASARRTRDLWFGSQLLSELAKTVARTIAEHEGYAQLIFPAPSTPEDLLFATDLNVANKIVALIETNPYTLGEKIQTNVNAIIDHIAQPIFADIQQSQNLHNTSVPLPFHEQVAYQQIHDLVELSWVAVPYIEDQDQYNETRNNVEALMAARKNTRDFLSVPWHTPESEPLTLDQAAKTMPKSSIDGHLESVIAEELYPRIREKQADQIKKTRDLYRSFHAGPAERLSGVDLLKRLGRFQTRTQAPHPTPTTQASETQPDEDAFPSTSHIAALPYLHRLTTICHQTTSHQTHLQQLFQTYLTSVRNLHIPALDRVPAGYPPHPILNKLDGAILYPERHLDKLTTQHASGLGAVQQTLAQFFKQVNTLCEETLEPSPYYAIIQADGDSMGMTIDALAQFDHGHARHQAFSQTLDAFARQVQGRSGNGEPGIIAKHQGALIYAGGDDVLAFVPLHKVLRCVRELKDAFKKHMEASSAFHNLPADIPRPTFSLGIAIVHHLSLLQDALQVARTAEKRAKQVPHKNALAITISKRGGEQYSVAGTWGDIDNYLKLLIHYFHNDYLPRGAAYELRAMVQRLTILTNPEDAENLKQQTQLKSIMRQDAGRILQRKLNLPQSKLAGTRQQLERKHSQQLLETITATLITRIERADTLEQTEQRPAYRDEELSYEQMMHDVAWIQPVPINELIHELIIAHELAAAATLAYGRPDTTTHKGGHCTCLRNRSG
jgi:CRISPR-associated protein Cmr2